MSETTDLARLREVAATATAGPWDFHALDDLHTDTAGWVGAPGEVTSAGVYVAEVSNTAEGLSDGGHIATFDPPTVTALLDEHRVA